MYELSLRTGEVRLLRFEDVSDSDQPTMKVYKSKTCKVKQVQISQSLYKEIKDYEECLIKKGVNDKTLRQTTKNEQVLGHFMFADSKSTILKKFKRSFGGTLENFNIRPKDLREISLKKIIVYLKKQKWSNY